MQRSAIDTGLTVPPLQALLREPAAAWRRASTPWRLAYAVGTLLVLVGLAHGAAWLVVGGAWEGPVSFRKPFSFGLSFGMTTITLAWVADRLNLGRGAGWALLLPLALADISEVAWVSLQRARGVASHFNFDTPLDTALFNLMGGAAVAVAAVVVIAIAVLAFLRRTDDPALTLAFRVGLLLLLVAVAAGGAMIGLGVDRAAAGQTEDLVRWGEAGNMKVTHALGIHGMQVLSGLAVWLSATAVAADKRGRIVAVAAVAYTGLVIAGTLQWLDGRALLEVGLLDGVLWVASIITLAGVVVAALGAVRTPRPAAP